MNDHPPTANPAVRALPNDLGDVVKAATLRPVASAKGAEMDQVLHLYRGAIPARERKAEIAIRGMIASPTHRLEIADIDGEIAGFFLLYQGEAVSLLEYLVTAEAVRGRGLGAELYRRARLLALPRPLLVEVDSDEEWSADEALRRRRIAFYRRLGCRSVDGLSFVLPLPGESAPPQLKLLVDTVAGPSLPAAELSGWLREIYTGVYGMPSDDPRLDAMVGALPPSLFLI